MNNNPTFVFEGDTVYAYLDGKVVASAHDVDELEAHLAMSPPMPATPQMGAGLAGGAQPCPHGADPTTCPACAASGAGGGAPGAIPPMMGRATHVETPNGLKGQILGKTKTVWGDEVTIRLENGRIAKFEVTPECKFTSEKKIASTSPYISLNERLAAQPSGDRKSLVERIKELKAIKRDAIDIMRQGNALYDDRETIDRIVTAADYEVREAADAISALDDAIPMAPPSFDYGVAEQESMGQDSPWLTDTLEKMVSENEANDFDQMMNEGPESFVADLETPALGDAGTVRQMASSFIASKTAGLDPEAVQEFKSAFLERVEQVRKAELTNRKVEAKSKEVTASADDGIDEGLFI